MASLTALRALNVPLAPTYAPVGVFVGGTSGIGQAMAESFARMTDGKATIVIVGRNKTAAESIISTLPRATDSTYEFVSCDATLMRNVVAASQDIISRHPKVNFLVMSPGFFSMKGFNPTDEGIDRKLAVNYYARWKFIDQFLPALKKAKDDGEDAKVFSVFGAGRGGPIDVNDLGLKKSYSLINASRTGPTYNDLMVEVSSSTRSGLGSLRADQLLLQEYARRNPELTFTHGFPGAVLTNFAASAESGPVRVLAPLRNLLLKPFASSPAECAEHMWQAVFNHTTGAFRTGSKGENIGKERYFGTDDQQQKLWEHSVSETNVSTPA
jgi:NAD(P)-dependent dehydrogenase (short-subunit alcohol dehydrogenase family)